MDKAAQERERRSLRSALVGVRNDLDDLIELLESRELPTRMIGATARRVLHAAMASPAFLHEAPPEPGSHGGADHLELSIAGKGKERLTSR
jgi:hypothetical protein